MLSSFKTRKSPVIHPARWVLTASLLVTAFLAVACSEAPKPVPPPSSTPQAAPTTPQPATGTPPSGEQPGGAAPELPPVPDNIQKLEKEYAAKPTDAKVKADLTKAKLDYGNELMFKSQLQPKVKYRAALKMYREVLELDPSNKEAQTNKAQIEEIYKSMGRPIPS